MKSKPSDHTPDRARESHAAPPAVGRSAGSARPGRGQSTLDFALGASLFLLALIGVLVFVSGTMEPFAEGSQEDIGAADRVADSLAEGLLADPARPHVLNATCTVAFFEDTSPNHCRFSGDNLTARTGVKNWKQVNVTMQANLTGDAAEETLCWDTTGGVVPRSESACDRVFTAGSMPPVNAGDTVTARRVVWINGTDATMRVEVW